MVLAAGRGERMRPLTDRRPKPLLEVGGKPLIVHCIQRLVAAGIVELVINHSWQGEQVVATLGDGRDLGAHIEYSPEPPPPLEVAGGIIQALPQLGEPPFAAVNADVWCDFPFEILPHEPRGLAHLILVDNPQHHPHGDFGLDGEQVAPESSSSLTFAGIGVYRPALFAALPHGPRPLAPILRAAMTADQVTGQHYRGDWVDVGTPERLRTLDARLRSRTLGTLNGS